MLRPMAVGAFVSTGRSIESAVARVRLAESLGYESVYVTHIAGRESLTVLTIYAAATERIRLGTGVVPIYTRTPATIAQTAATIDEFSGGRLTLGLGVSHRPVVEGWHGQTIDKPASEMREYASIVRAILRGEDPPAGEKWDTGFHLVGVEPRPALPIYIAALSPRMLRLAGEIADGVTLNMMPVEAVPRMVEHVRAGAMRAGKDPAQLEIVARFQVCVTDDEAAARAVLRAVFGPYFATSVYNRFVAWCGFDDEAREILAGWRAKDRGRVASGVTDDMLDRIGIFGSAEECRERIEAFRAAGVTTPMVSPFFPDEQVMWRTFEALAPR